MKNEYTSAVKKVERVHLSSDGTTPETFVRDGVLHVSAEHGDGAADYYGEFHDGTPWINPKLEDIAEEHGLYWEWVNPGSIALYD